MAATDRKQQEFLENATTQTKHQDDIDQKVEALFVTAKGQIFEDGMESEFSKELISLIRKHGSPVVVVLTDLIVNEKVNAEVASEALRWLGRVDHLSSYRHRLWLLERSLRCTSARVRDGITKDPPG